eukprot:scaffold350392_cov20-Prasinocladus_malaysianus.AAC.1
MVVSPSTIRCNSGANFVVTPWGPLTTSTGAAEADIGSSPVGRGKPAGSTPTSADCPGPLGPSVRVWNWSMIPAAGSYDPPSGGGGPAAYPGPGGAGWP